MNLKALMVLLEQFEQTIVPKRCLHDVVSGVGGDAAASALKAANT